MSFSVQATATSGISTTWNGQAPSLPLIHSAIPREFNGPGGGYSPEDLFALSLLNCLIATFKVYCEKSNAAFQEIRGKIDLTVDRVPGQAGFAITHADIFLEVTGSSDPAKVKKLLDTTVQDCAVSNSIKSGKTFHINIS